MVNPVLIDIRRAELSYADSQYPVFSKLDMQIFQGQWNCILGRSGCGKSSLLRYLSGLLSDKVNFCGDVIWHSESSSQVAYMAQQDLLMPWLSVIDNVCLSLIFTKPEDAISAKQKALSLIDAVGLSEHVEKLPHQLSGGMRQRAALARTLMQDKPVILMDEPFSALDAVTRYKLQNLSARLLKGKTVILITHDPQEALRLGNHIYIMTGQPASAVKLPSPLGAVPRNMDASLAIAQQEIIQTLEKDYV